MKSPPQTSILALLTILLHFAQYSSAKNHYDTLEIKQDASHNQIRKAYRRLALKYHPDRIKGSKEESSERFHEVGNAYKVLSNENSRRDYDNSLLYGTEYDLRHGSGWDAGHHRGKYRDPFEQFDSLFENDPFFRDAFEETGGLFDTLFDNDFDNVDKKKVGSRPEKKGFFGDMMGILFDNDFDDMFDKRGGSKPEKKGFFGSMMNNFGTSDFGGGTGAHALRIQRNHNKNDFATYTSSSTKTLIQNGQKVTIKSLEKDGSKIEEKYIDGKLVERKVNGALEQIDNNDNEDVPKITGFEGFKKNFIAEQ